MSDDNKGGERVTFSRGYDVCIMAIDGTWRRDCQLNSISDTDATLTVEGSIQGLNLKEFFLLLSSTGLAYRRCELVRVNGADMDIHFLRGKHAKKRPGANECSLRGCGAAPRRLFRSGAIAAFRQGRQRAIRRRPARLPAKFHINFIFASHWPPQDAAAPAPLSAYALILA